MMKALYKRSRDAYDMSITEMPIPVPRPHEVVIKVHAAGICGTDLKIYQGEYHDYQPPLIIGHEFSGHISRIGSAVKDWSLGTKVVARTIVQTCRVCSMCLTNRENMCDQKKRLGFDYDGAFAEYVKVHKDQLHRIPRRIKSIDAALIEPLAVVVHALSSLSIQPTDNILIIGPGPIGLISLLYCKSYRARVAIAGLRRDRSRLSIAKKLGADLLLFVNEGQHDGQVRFSSQKDVLDFNIVVECTGTAGGIDLGLDLCCKGGRFVQIGTRSTLLALDFTKIAYKEIAVSGSIGHTKQDCQQAIHMVERGRFDFSFLTNQVYSLEQWNEAFRVLERREVVKVLFKMN